MRIALYQCHALPQAPAENLERLRLKAREAAAHGADLLVCPEMFITGYNIGAGNVQQAAQAWDGAWARQVAEIARECAVAIVYGYPERCPQGAVYNAVQAVDAQGNCLANYRKTHLFGALDTNAFVAGDRNSPLFVLNGWKLGLLICYDVEFPEACRQLALAGADLLVVPTANMHPYEFIAEVTVRSRAFENQCYLCYANYCGSEFDLDYCGQSSIVGPDGQFLAKANEQPALLMATLDAGVLACAREQNPYLKMRRPELYDAMVKAVN